MLSNEIKFDNIDDYMAYLFGFDTFSITHKPNGHINIDAEINKVETATTFYKLFVSSLDEIDKCEKDFKALTLLKNSLKKHKNDFDKIIDDRKVELERLFKKYNPTINVSYSGEFGKIYNRVKSLVG